MPRPSAAIIAVAALAAVAVSATTPALVRGLKTSPLTAMQQEFGLFKSSFKKVYASAEEEQKRFVIFTENMKKAHALMKVNPLAVFGAPDKSPYLDLSPEEFKSRHNGEKAFGKLLQQRHERLARIEQRKSKGLLAGSRDVVALATTKHEQLGNNVRTAAMVQAGSHIDWRNRGAVTPIKNQGQCGSCWSFSTTGSIEGQWFLAGNTLTSLGEQYLVSCDTTNNGCHGGLMDAAFEWLVSSNSGQIYTDASYPYVSGNGQVPACNVPANAAVGATITGHVDVQGDEGVMAGWVYANGPMSIGVDATSWQSYNGGIMTNCISQQVDHGVLIVGFDDNSNPPYWIIKNQWGSSWGEDGYIRVAKGSNQCLITTAPCSATVGGATPTPGPVPPPSPPSPTPPPAPSPASTFEQVQCTDSSCQTGCQTSTFQQGQCLQTQSGGSLIAQCVTVGLLVTSYTAGDCTGASTQNTIQTDTCEQQSSGTGSFYFSCNGSGSTSGSTSGGF